MTPFLYLVPGCLFLWLFTRVISNDKAAAWVVVAVFLSLWRLPLWVFFILALGLSGCATMGTGLVGPPSPTGKPIIGGLPGDNRPGHTDWSGEIVWSDWDLGPIIFRHVTRR